MKNITHCPTKPETAKTNNMKKPLFLFAAVLLLSFTGDSGRAVYEVPHLLQSIASADLDLDGDIDIVTGHNVSSSTLWGGLYILENDGAGLFPYNDSVFLYEYQSTIVVESLSPEAPPSIIARHSENDTLFTVVVKKEDSSYTMDKYPMQYGNYDFTTGNMNNDTLHDIVFITFENNYLGTMINDGTGKFNEPEYFNTIDFEPLTINCADFDNNGLDDVVFTGVYAEVYFNYGDHFEKLELENGTGRTNTHIVDFDGDGDLDIVAYTCFWGYSFVSVQENIDGQSFELREVLNFEELTNEFAASDFNNDGLPDAAFHLMDNSGLIVYFNQGDFVLDKPVFIDSETGDGGGCVMNCADFDNNGFNDVAYCRNLSDSSIVNILYNDGNGGFNENPVTSVFDNKTKASHKYNFACVPNPIRSYANFSFDLPLNVKVKVKIFDLQGMLMATIPVDEAGQAAWHLIGKGARKIRPGAYVAALVADGVPVESIKIIKQ